MTREAFSEALASIGENGIEIATLKARLLSAERKIQELIGELGDLAETTTCALELLRVKSSLVKDAEKVFEWAEGVSGWGSGEDK